MYDEAIEAYKNALRNNPNDDETRYNLVLCKHLKKKQDEKQKQNQQNKDDQNKKDDQKKDDKKDQKQDKKDDKQQEQQKPQMSKDNAEQLLNAAIQNEKMTQDKMKKAQQQPQRRAIQKNW
jgi:Ca-activated chloride channel family protein